MKKLLRVWALLLAMPLAAPAVTIDLVTVVDPGNDTNTGSVGSVDYNYQIGTFEVMNSQYVEFLNSVAATDTYGLYQPMMGFSAWGGITRSGSSGGYTYSVKANMSDKPVNYISFYDAVRFVNWLENGQPIGAQGPGTTETGTYSLFTVGGSTTNASSRDPAPGGFSRPITSGTRPRTTIPRPLARATIGYIPRAATMFPSWPSWTRRAVLRMEASTSPTMIMARTGTGRMAV